MKDQLANKPIAFRPITTEPAFVCPADEILGEEEAPVTGTYEESWLNISLIPYQGQLPTFFDEMLDEYLCWRSA